MKKLLTLSALFAGLAFLLTGRVTATAPPVPAAETVRTVYFSAIDAQGALVNDLTAADLAVKEGGKAYPIASVQAATAPMQISLLVDDQGTGVFQYGIGQFLQATIGHAQFAISILNPQPMKIANFVEDAPSLQTAIGKLGQRGKIQVDGEQIIEAVGEAAKELQGRKAPRPVVIALSVSGETALSDRADPVLNTLKASGAGLNVLYYAGITTGKVLGDGPKQSGGMVQQSGSGPGMGPALMKIADSLMHQYALTYNLPDGTKMSEKLQLTTTRKGITLIAPQRIPDK